MYEKLLRFLQQVHFVGDEPVAYYHLVFGAVQAPDGDAPLKKWSRQSRSRSLNVFVNRMLHDDDAHAQHNGNIAYGISVFHPKSTSRLAKDALGARTLVLDIDCGEGKPYPDKRSAAKELQHIVNTLRKTLGKDFPTPIVVDSGGGLYTYWPLDVTNWLQADEWKALSLRWATMLYHAGLKFDTSKCNDPAMVVRTPYTYNRKRGEPVLARVFERTMEHNVPLPPSTAHELVNRYESLHGPMPDLRARKDRQAPRPATARGPEATVTIPPHVAGKVSRIDVGDLGATPLPDGYVAPSVAQLRANCAVLDYVAANRGNVREPLWFAALGAAAFANDEDAAVAIMSDGHPEYDEHDTAKRVRRWKDKIERPVSCATLRKAEIDDRSNPVNDDTQPSRCRCDGCPFRNIRKRMSPNYVPHELHYQPIRTPQTVLDRLEPVPLPHGYVQTSEGIVQWQQGTDALRPEEKMVLDGLMLYLHDSEHDISPQDDLQTASYRAKGFYYRLGSYGKRGGRFVLNVSDMHTNSGNRALIDLANQGAFIGTNRREKAVLFLSNYLRELENHKLATKFYQMYGWVNDEDHGEVFSLEGRAYCKVNDSLVTLEGGVSPAVCTPTADYTDGKKGSLEEWARVTQYLDRPGMEQHGFALLCGLATPLLKAQGLNGCAVSLYGNTGTGKTTILRWVNSIYGPPHKTSLVAGSTAKAIERKLTSYNGVPMTIDEITHWMGNDKKDTSDLLLMLTQGQARTVLTKTRQMEGGHSYNTIALLTTNASLTERIMRGNNTAELARVLELSMGADNPIFQPNVESYSGEATDIHTVIENNYGVAVEPLLSAIMKMDQDRLRAVYEKARDAVQQKFNFRRQERFIANVITCAYMAGIISKKLGIIRFNPTRVIEGAIESVNRLRNRMDDMHLNGAQLVQEYLSRNKGTTLHTTYIHRDDSYIDRPDPAGGSGSASRVGPERSGRSIELKTDISGTTTDLDRVLNKGICAARMELHRVKGTNTERLILLLNRDNFDKYLRNKITSAKDTFFRDMHQGLRKVMPLEERSRFAIGDMPRTVRKSLFRHIAVNSSVSATEAEAVYAIDITDNPLLRDTMDG